jgi:Ca-activated chloride channel family protein
VTIDLFDQSLRLADPWALALGALGLAAFVVAALREARPAGGVLFPSLGLLPGRTSSWRSRLRWVLLPMRLAAVLLLVVALARPEVAQAAIAEGIDIALVIDVSASMLATDLGTGTRMQAVKRAATTFVQGLKDDRVGVVVFGGDALELSPLTLDYTAVRGLIEPIEAGELVAGGTAIGTGLATTVNMLRESPAKSKVAVLLTDGENNAGEIGPLDAAQLGRVLGVRVYTIGAVSLERGDEVDEQALRQMAELTGGRYYHATDEAGLVTIYREIAQLEKARVGTRGYDDYEPRHLPFLLLGGALLLVELLLAASLFRRVP